MEITPTFWQRNSNRLLSRMLNRVLRDVDGAGIVTVDSKMLLINTVIKEKFLHP